MPWVKERKTVWRVVILVGVLLTLAGPWTFDVTWVPPEYSCSAPHVRLDNKYCGVPQSGARFLRFLVLGTIHATGRLVAGPGDFAQRARESLVGLILLLLVLPVFCTLLLVLIGDHRCWQVFNSLAWGLAACFSLLMGVLTHPRLFWVLWGLWLYIALATIALILEVLTLAGRSTTGASSQVDVTLRCGEG
jgi:hypothetical protein